MLLFFLGEFNYPFVCIYGRKLGLHLTRVLAISRMVTGKNYRSGGGGDEIAMCSTKVFGVGENIRGISCLHHGHTVSHMNGHGGNYTGAQETS